MYLSYLNYYLNTTVHGKVPGRSGGVKEAHSLVRVCDREAEHRWLRG